MSSAYRKSIAESNGLEWSSAGRVTRYRPCPICDKADWCIFDNSGYFVLCMRSANPAPGWLYIKETRNEYGESGYLYKSELLRDEAYNWTTKQRGKDAPPLENFAVQQKKFLAWLATQQKQEPNNTPRKNLHINVGTDVISGKNAEPPERAPIEVLHLVYVELLASLQLNDQHLSELTDPNGSRRLTIPETCVFGAKSVATDMRPILDKLERQFGAETLLKVPGFFLNKQHQVDFAIRRGLLIPIKNESRQITGIVVRLDKTATPDAPKYIWLSSSSAWIERAGGQLGPSAVARACVYTPALMPQSDTVGITEGQFKGFIAAQRLGIPMICVPGVMSWGRSGAIEIAQKFVGTTGKVIIFYDNEDNPATTRAKWALADALTEQQIEVEIASWKDRPEKGIDDLLLAGGTYHAQYYIPGLQDIFINTTLNARYLAGELYTNKAKRVSLIRSPKGTGKTQWLKELLMLAQAAGWQAILVGHRRSLLKEACAKLGLQCYLDVKNKNATVVKNWMGQNIAVCVDSISMIRLDQLKNFVLIFDESEQVLRHLTGETVRRQNHHRIFAAFMALVEKAQKVVCLDADLGHITYNFFANKFGNDNVEFIANKHKGSTRTIYQHKSQNTVLAEIVKRIGQGKKEFIATNSREKSKVIYDMLRHRFPNKRGWLINAEEANSPIEQQKIEQINKAVMQYDYIVASPSLGTGVSIDVVDYFDAVFLLAESKVTTHLDLLQQVFRVRNPISGEIHAWINPRCYDYIMDAEALKKQKLENARETYSLCLRFDPELGDFMADGLDATYLDLWATIEALHNSSINNLVENFFRQAKFDGHNVQEFSFTPTTVNIAVPVPAPVPPQSNQQETDNKSSGTDSTLEEEPTEATTQNLEKGQLDVEDASSSQVVDEPPQEPPATAPAPVVTYVEQPMRIDEKFVRADFKASRERVQDHRQNLIVAAPDIDQKTARKLERADQHQTSQERASLEKHQMKEFYGQPVTPELVKQDDKGRLRWQVRNFIALCNRDYALERDRTDAKAESLGRKFVPHWRNLTIKRDLRIRLMDAACLFSTSTDDYKKMQDSFYRPFEAGHLKLCGFTKFVREHQAEIERVLEIKIRSDFDDNPVPFLSAMFEQVGLDLECTQRRLTIYDNEGNSRSVRKRSYKISEKGLYLMQDLASNHLTAEADRAKEKQQQQQQNSEKQHTVTKLENQVAMNWSPEGEEMEYQTLIAANEN